METQNKGLKICWYEEGKDCKYRDYKVIGFHGAIFLATK